MNRESRTEKRDRERERERERERGGERREKNEEEKEDIEEIIRRALTSMSLLFSSSQVRCSGDRSTFEVQIRGKWMNCLTGGITVTLSGKSILAGADDISLECPPVADVCGKRRERKRG